MKVLKNPEKSKGWLWKRAGVLAGVFLLSLWTVLPLHAQTKTITGTVVDAEGEAIAGATIVVKGTTVSTLSDVVGRFTIQATPEVTLVVSFIGYRTQEIAVGNQVDLNVVLAEDTKVLDEVVVVGYGTQKKISVTGAVSQIQGEELLKAPTGNISNLLGGRVAGVVSLQESGQPGSDGASVLVRGSGVRYFVDGVERDFSQIDPNEIATVSVLKDASAAAVYGLGTMAAVIVTTKRGQVAPSHINFTASYGVSLNTEMLQLLDAPQYAYWYNKARVLDGNEPVFSQEHVQKMLAGEDGWGNTNWYKKTFGTGTNAQYNVNASGGTENIKYFASLGYFNQTGNVENFNFDRITLRSNVDAKIAKNLTLTFDVSGRIEKHERPYYSAGPNDWLNIPQQAIRALPFVPMEYDGLPVSTRTASSIVSPLAASGLSGYRREKSNILQSTLALNYELPWVKGLSAKFAVSYDYVDGNSKQFFTPYEVNVATRPATPAGAITYVKSFDASGTNASLSEGATYNSTLTTNTSLRYENKFGLHNITTLALMETRQNDANALNGYGRGYDIYSVDELTQASEKDRYTAGGSSSQARWVGFLGRINYSYADKYLAEVTMRYDGSYLFAGKNISGNRWVFTPAASLGWRMSEENWFKNALPFVDNFKLRGGIGLTGLTDGVKPYFYLNTLKFLGTSAVVFGDTPTGVSGLYTSVLANANLTWAKSLQYNAGFDATLWKGLLGVEFDVFYKYLYDLPGAAGSYPDSFGGYAPSTVNVNKQDHKGFEIQLSHENRISAFYYRVTVNGTYAYRRWLHYEESPNLPDYLKLTGREVGSLQGLIALGLFQSEEEIANSATILGSAVRVGDIKYLDRNGDGIISHFENGKQDWGYIGKSAYPDFVGGFSFYGEWKGIDISFLFQGALGRTVTLTGMYPLAATGGTLEINDNTFLTKAFYHDGNTPLYLVENSWTPDNPNSEFARLSITGGSNQNGWASTFWYRNGDYLRLKSLQIGYNFPKKWLSAVGVNALRVYVEGQNLLTFSELNKYGIDPEQPTVNNGYYPQQKVFAGGIKLTF